MKILITTTRVPFINGGAEILAHGLLQALLDAGHEAEVLAIPFKWYPAEQVLDHMLACRLFDLTESCGTKIDQVIALKFPTYLISHPNQVAWILHQHRSAYDLWNRPMGDMHHFSSGLQIRDAIRKADRELLPQSKGIYTIAQNVSNRLQKYCGIPSEPIYHPPQNAEQFYSESAEDYFFFPSRLSPIKRQSLVVEALAHTSEPVCVRFAGAADADTIGKDLRALARDLEVDDRVEWLGPVDEAHKRELYARSLAVIFPPVDEDYGYVTLEAMLASKAVVTCDDSGGSLEFVKHDETGLVVEPTPESMAAALDQLWQNRLHAARLGVAGRDHYASMRLSWSNVVRRLVA